MKYLFENFLTDHTVHMEAKRYWESMCAELLGIRVDDWETWPLNEGDDDGNPIFAIQSRRLKKAVRIIQVPPGSEEAWERRPISSWFDTKGDDLPGSIAVDEVVVHCLLSLETADVARRIIGEWFNDCYRSR